MITGSGYFQKADQKKRFPPVVEVWKMQTKPSLLSHIQRGKREVGCLKAFIRGFTRFFFKVPKAVSIHSFQIAGSGVSFFFLVKHIEVEPEESTFSSVQSVQENLAIRD